MKSIFFFYLSWNSECAYSIWSSMKSLLLAQLPAGMTECRCDLLTFLKVSSDATQNRTKHPSWMPFMLIPESIHFQDHYWAFMHCQKIVFQQFSHSLCCVSFGAFYIINHFNSHCMLQSPCAIIRNLGNLHIFPNRLEMLKIKKDGRSCSSNPFESLKWSWVFGGCYHTMASLSATFLPGKARFLWLPNRKAHE